jgi:hypothetical protein
MKDTGGQFAYPTGKIQGSPRMASKTNNSVATGQHNKPSTMGKDTGQSATNKMSNKIGERPRYDDGHAPLENAKG